MVISDDFYTQNTINIAQELLGCRIVHYTDFGIISGVIVETEAYLSNDPASHSYHGKNHRNSAMFGKAGSAYIYFIYGMHYCFNVVGGQEGLGEAVLIRTLEPKTGIGLMKKYRKKDDIRNLCSGPAKLVEALNITKNHNGISLLGPPLYIEHRIDNNIDIVSCERIGIIRLKMSYYVFILKTILLFPENNLSII
ncbi:MAG: DNA-3-methyladenine glycosylase [bacterium]|nr:DNA-3-methyladenine glycosylase [bacterium]